LIRRLPIILAEDCGYRKIGHVWPLKIRGPVPDEGETKEILRLVAHLALGPKDKDAPALAEAAALFEKEKSFAFPKSLLDALDRRHELLSMRCALEEIQKMKVGEGVWDALLRYYPYDRKEDGLGSVLLIRDRVKTGGFRFEGDVTALVAVLVLVCCRPDERTVRSPEEDEIVRQVMNLDDPMTLDWYCLDAHTQIGRIALGFVAKKKDLDRKMLEDYQFYFESAKVNDLYPQKWFDGFVKEMHDRHHTSPAHAAILWGQVRPDVQGMTEWLMSKRGKK
jgi:hypothetical protein